MTKHGRWDYQVGLIIDKAQGGLLVGVVGMYVVSGV